VSASSLKPTAWLAGVDEAGLGPILGPLVVAGTILEGPVGTDPWLALDSIVCRGAPDRHEIQVADSKRVNQGPNGLARLERTALAFWAAAHGEIPADLEELLEATGADLDQLRRCPWYRRLDLALPIENDRDEIELRAHLLSRALDERSITLHRIAIRALDVEEFNESIAASDNKSDTHFDAFGSVVAALVRELPPGGHLVADRCGGRVHYRQKLCARFPHERIRTLGEHADRSVYRVSRGASGSVRLTFATGGEELAFPTALASCFAKYLREAMLRVLNGWFAERVPGLRPTAGYWVDGRRFLADVDGLVDREQLPRERLVRVR
jgi:ribonuclease HII